MAFSSGTFARLYNFVNDRNAGTKILASRVDGELDGIATGLSTCLLKDGSQTVTANLPLGGYKITNLGLATAGGDALSQNAGDARYTKSARVGGRLTLTTAVPVLVSTVSGASTIYWTPYVDNQIIHYDGSTFVTTTSAEMSLALSGLANNSNYDVFSYLVSTTPTLKLGPAWTSDTARGTGTGTTELVRVNGVWLNAVAISSGPAIQRGTYLGTIRTNGSGTVDFILGATASGGTAAVLNVWNAFNRIPVTANVGDSDNWTYSTGTWRSAHNLTTNRVSLVRGLNEDIAEVEYSCPGSTASANIGVGIGLDSTSAPSGRIGAASAGAAWAGHLVGSYSGVPGLGFHYFQALEYGNSNGVNFNNTSISTTQAQMLTARVLA